MSSVQAAPVLVKELPVSVLAGTTLLGLWFGHGLPEVGTIAWERFRSPDNLATWWAKL